MDRSAKIATAIACSLVMVACGGSDADSGAGDGAAGRGEIGEVVSVPIESRNHVTERVVYDLRPPAGGDHFPVWTTCGFYTVEVPEMTAVHSLEHGAVWFTYRADLPAADIEALKALAASNDKVLVSLYPRQQTPLVGTAWGVQVALEEFGDDAVAFVEDYESASSAPEGHVTCQEGLGLAPDIIDQLSDGSVVEVPR